jgi:CBS domain-containing protein
MSIPVQLTQAAATAKEKGAVPFTPRELVEWHGYSRRGSWIVAMIRKNLKTLGVRTEPDFETVWVDVPIKLMPISDEKPEAVSKERGAPSQAAAPNPDAVEVAPSHRNSRLKAANVKPVSVKPTDKLETAVTLMMSHDFSQLPVMTNDRDVKGLVSWRSIGNRLALGKKCEMVKDCMDQPNEVHDTASMFDVIRLLAQHECVLVRDSTNLIRGIVTAADISEQFRLLSEPFLLLGDIENDLRRLIERSFSVEELRKARDPADEARKVESAADLTFGEYERLLENPENWVKLKMHLDRVVFMNKVREVRLVRNDVMHFDPDGVDASDLGRLREFSGFLDRTLHLLD